MDEFAALKDVSPEFLFHLENGEDIGSIRDLAVAIESMDENTFKNHIDSKDFVKWIRHVFEDDELANKIDKITKKNSLIKTLRDHLILLEERKLHHFGVFIPTTKLEPVENYIENELEQGQNIEKITKILKDKGWDPKIVRLIVESKEEPYKQSLSEIQNMDKFHEKLERIKSYMLNYVANGGTLEDVRRHLLKNGWHPETIEFIIYDVYKPHPNIKKLTSYIINQVKNKGKTLEQVKSKLLELGWKEYIIDSIIYGKETFENNINKVLDYVEEFSPQNEERIKEFLLKMGWDTSAVEEAIKKHEADETNKALANNYNIDEKYHIKGNAQHQTDTLRIMENNHDNKKLIKNLLHEENYRIIQKDDLVERNKGELQVNTEDVFYFNANEFRDIENNKATYYHSERKPLIVETHHKYYFLLPIIQKRECLFSKKLYPVNEMIKLEMWDEHRTKKVIRYVSKEHADAVNSFLGESHIIQD